MMVAAILLLLAAWFFVAALVPHVAWAPSIRTQFFAMNYVCLISARFIIFTIKNDL